LGHFKSVMFCAPFYRFVHTLDSIRSSPETLGFEEVNSAGFSAQAHQTSPAVRLAPVKPMPMCEDLERILAIVHINLLSLA